MEPLGCHINIAPTLGFTAAGITARNTSYKKEGFKFTPGGIWDIDIMG